MFYGANFWYSVSYMTYSSLLYVIKSWAFIVVVVLISSNFYCWFSYMWTILKALIEFNFKILNELWKQF